MSAKSARQIASAVIRAVLEAAKAPAGERTARMQDAVIDTLTAHDVALPRPGPPAVDAGTEP